MPAPRNMFKLALAEGRPQIGLWLALANPYTAEICGGAGFDWLLIDGEHAPNDVPLMMAQLQALSGSNSHAIIRPPIGEPWLIKQLLDIGAQTLLVPMVETGEQARALVRAVRYPPHGMRGVGAALARASAFNRIDDYLPTANAEICLLLQVESRAGLAALDDIASTEGVDGVFIGPADLAADMGFLGKPGAPEVQEAVEAALARIQSHGKAAGILTSDTALAKRYLELGALFVAVGNDVSLLVGATSRLRASFAEYVSASPAGANAPASGY
ncbi:4-hydroxy-2-oxoheptanedioate aldolase [Ensifer sp. LC163]|uniref:4-hydroxy-2-oxoheptanedioate aldolase n=1 Tax=Ensifer sp. LC163 TaxID=1120652 RepID=UPI000812C261|nr:4-hydroxy-2-oxoheptanedioate aldolase [Ensifer sp. LC163]OCP35878.1 2,4-dihydroxyhept-2-ene-1,7-dioic acid aldolase [Ensifer sp. LC163]